MKKNIVHIVDTLCVGGREKIVIDICNNLNKDHYNVHIITLTNDMNEIANLVNGKEVDLIALPLKHGSLVGIKTLFNFFKAVLTLRNVIKSLNPEIIHTHSYLHRLLIVFTSIKSLSSKITVFHTVHTSGMYYNPKSLVDKFKLQVERSIIGILRPNLISISEIIHQNNQRLFKEQSNLIKYIPNGIDLNFFNKQIYNIEPERFGVIKSDIVLTYVARFCEGKNHITLLKALNIIVAKYDNVKLILAGDGGTRNEIEDFIEEYSLGNKVILLGAISNISELLSITAIAVFPSEFEGFTLTLIEKMAMGLPVVAADNDIFKKLIKHRENGFLFSMFDSQALAENVIELIEDEILYKEVSKNSILFSKQFSIERMVFEHEDYYNLINAAVNN